MVVDHPCATSLAVAFGGDSCFAYPSGPFDYIADRRVYNQLLLEGGISIVVQKL